MADKKVYTIEINGIKESADAVESLNKQLSELENRIKALEKSSVKVNTSSSSGGGSKSSLNEEEKIAKQIEQIDAKRKAYSKEIYQNYLAAKDVLDETVKDQKQIAAAERLQANSYSNTMQGMKEKLKDIQTLRQVTDISSDAFKQMTADANELVEKLKELEAQTGSFGRNVGNYQSAFDGLEKVSVTIGGVTKEFNNLMQAQKAVKNEMGVLIDKGKENTDQYKKLEQELERLAKSQKKLNSAMNDAKASSKAMDDLLDTFESFAALGQVGQGFSTLFGLDNSALEQQIAKLVALQNVLKGIEKIRQQMNTEEGIGGWLTKGSKAIDKFVAGLAGADIRMGKIIGSSKQASIALNGVSTALKGIATGGVAIVLPFLMDFFDSFVKKLREMTFGTLSASDAAEILGKKAELLAKKAKDVEKSKMKEYLEGTITQEEYMIDKTQALSDVITKLIGDMANIRKVDFSDLTKGTKFSDIKVGYSTEGNNPNSDDINERARAQAEAYKNAVKEFEKLGKKMVELEEEADRSMIPLFRKLTNGATEVTKDFEQLGKALTSSLLYDMKSILDGYTEAQNKAKQEISQYGAVTDETKRKIDFYKQAILALREALNDPNIGALFDNIDKFSKSGQYYIRQINVVREALEGLANSMSTATLDPDKLLQLQIDAMKDSEEKIRKQNALNRKKEMAEVGYDPEYKKAIDAKYDRELQENLKAYRKSKKQEADQKKKEERDVQREIDEYTIQLMREGLEKQIAELRNEEKYKRKEIEDSGIRVGERTNLLTEVYNKKELELRRDWAREIKEIYEKLGEDIENIERDIFDSGLDTSETNLDTNTAKKKQSTGDNLITPINYDNIDELKNYYKTILEIEQNAADEETKIAKERLKRQMEYDKEDEKRRHNNLVDPNNGEYKKQLEQGKITQEQYDELIERENKAHTEKMKAIDAQYAADSEKIIQDSLDKKRSAYNTYYTSVIAEIRKNQDRISKESSSIDKRQDNAAFGFFNIKAVMKGYDELISKEKIAVEKIRTERDKLVQDKNNGKISGEDFLVRQEELDAAEEAAMGSIEDLEKKQKASLDKFIGAIMAAVQVVGQSIQQIFSAVWDAQDVQFEKEQEQLDKMNDILDKKLDEQQDIVEQHKNAIDSIEDELATSRGSRRQHLIDQLNAEMEAQKQAAKEQQRLEKEKEKLQAKQDALDKKRKQAQYKRDMMQAIVNGAMAVTMAAINNWPVPAIPMMALAASTTAAQIAIMAANKPYAKGGQLDGGVAQGKRHRDGGIPVLGGRASIEGGEYITNRVTTSKNVELLDYINSKKKKIDINDLMDFYSTTPRKTIRAVRTKFEDGGYLPTLPNALDVRDQLQNIVVNQDNRPIYVSVVDINNKQEDVRRVQTLAGL